MRLHLLLIALLALNLAPLAAADEQPDAQEHESEAQAPETEPQAPEGDEAESQEVPSGDATSESTASTCRLVLPDINCLKEQVVATACELARELARIDCGMPTCPAVSKGSRSETPVEVMFKLGLIEVQVATGVERNDGEGPVFTRTKVIFFTSGCI